jgi:hypothetical protein
MVAASVMKPQLSAALQDEAAKGLLAVPAWPLVKCQIPHPQRCVRVPRQATRHACVTITEFTPGSALLAGALTHLVDVLLMLGIGRRAGTSGIFAGLMTLHFEDALIWRAIFILAMLLGPVAVDYLYTGASPIAFKGSDARTVIVAAMVGAGTVLAAGRTPRARHLWFVPFFDALPASP